MRRLFYSPAALPAVLAALVLTTAIGHAQRPQGAGGVGFPTPSKSWNGAGGNAKWSTAANWTPAIVPTGHENLSFPAVTNKSPANDIAIDGAGFETNMSIDGSGYGFTGNAVSACEIGSTYSSGSSSIGVTITPGTSCASSLHINVAAGGTLRLSGNATAATITVDGSGRFVHESASTAPAQHFVLSDATFFIQGDKHTSDLAMSSGVLAGSGTIGDVTATGGTISPEQALAVPVGFSRTTGVGGTTGILHTGNLTLNAASKAAFRIAGATVGTQYDQIAVTGTVALNNATLHLDIPFAAPAGTVFRIIDNDGVDPIVGTFDGVPEGTVGTIGALTGRVSYVGGTGNDVTITALASTLNPAITLSPASLPAMTVGAAVTTTLAAAGGTAPYVITLTSGALPAGLSFSSSTNQITGTPTTPGAYSVTFTATDNTAGYNTFTYTGTVAASVPAMSGWLLWLTAIGLLAVTILGARRAQPQA